MRTTLFIAAGWSILFASYSAASTPATVNNATLASFAKSVNALPYTKIPAAVAHSQLGPIDYLHPLRTDNAGDFFPSRDIVLYYAERNYQDASSYQGTINWTLTDPGLVVQDHAQITAINCNWAGIELVFDSLAAFDTALKWDSPLVLVTEGDQVSNFFLCRGVFLSILISSHLQVLSSVCQRLNL